MLGPVGVWSMTSLWRTHWLFSVIAAGQATCRNETLGLSAPWNQSNRQLQPALRAEGKFEQADLDEIPP